MNTPPISAPKALKHKIRRTIGLYGSAVRFKDEPGAQDQLMRFNALKVEECLYRGPLHQADRERLAELILTGVDFEAVDE